MNLDDLPDEIVQPLVRLGRALMTHALAHRDTSLAEHEDEVLAAWRIVAPALLEGVLQLAAIHSLQVQTNRHVAAHLSRQAHIR